MSFDGGGIRGIFSLQVAAPIEQLFRQEYGRPDLVLSDVIDLFAGTSTGAIIATFLAWGAPVAEVNDMYVSQSRQMFERQPWWRRLTSKYRAEAISEIFKQQFQEDDHTPALLNSAKLKKLLLIVMRNVTTGSPWPVCSSPLLPFNDLSLPECNLKLPLWQLLRASTAAPSMFPPQEILIGTQKFLFVDGGITPYNNPALLATLMATLPAYRLNWPAGRDLLHVTSIGTGEHRAHMTKHLPDKIYIWDHIHFVIPALIGAFSINQDMLCRVLGDCLHGAPLDMELGSLNTAALLAPAEQKFSYARFNCMMDSTAAGKPWTEQELMLDNIAMLPQLQELGRRYAQEHVQPQHLKFTRN
jgi:hypothetical protein